jgi:hypothetical protein
VSFAPLPFHHTPVDIHRFLVDSRSWCIASAHRILSSVSSAMSSSGKPPTPASLAPYDRIFLLPSQSGAPSPCRRAGRASVTASGPFSRRPSLSSGPHRSLEKISALCASFVSNHRSSRTTNHWLTFGTDHLALPVPQPTLEYAPGASDTSSCGFRRFGSTSNPPPFDRHVCRPATTTTIKNEVSCRPEFVWPPTLHLGIHDRIEGSL